jgi:DNA polymerase-3 subunit delta'
MPVMNKLSDIFCQDRAINSLQRAYNAGRMAHAYLFVGTDGVGKFTTAQQWAKMLLCSDKQVETVGDTAFNDSCGKCENCKVFDGGSHPDFKEVYKELIQYTQKGKGKKTPLDMPIDVIREFVIDKVASKPSMSDNVVFVIRQAERVNNASQNALLKVLEEPPKHCVIILLCSQLDKMLPTTQSRCQTVRFGPIDELRITERLVDVGVSAAEALYWARFSGSSLGQAIEWASLELKEGSCYQIKTELVTRIAKHSLADSIEIAEWMLNSARSISDAWEKAAGDTSKADIKRRALKGVIRMVIAVFQDAMRIGVEPNDQSIVNLDQRPQIKYLAEKLTSEQAADRIAKGYENIRWIDASVNEKLILEELLLNYAGSGILR